MKQIGQHIIHLDRVDSTNNYIANLFKSGEILHGSVIMADEQTKGRGQRGTTWQSETGLNLTASIFVELEYFPVLQQESINHWVALSILKTLKDQGIEAKVKWPNDVYVNDKKICGVLIENTVQSGYIKAVIIGVGLNVNQTNFEGTKGTSMLNERGGFLPIRTVLDGLLFHLNEMRTSFLMNAKQLKADYHLNMWKKDEEVLFEKSGVVYKGVILGTDEFGLLLMQVEKDVMTFDLKEIKFI